MSKTRTRGDTNIQWVEDYCTVPTGPHKGRRARLTVPEREIIVRLYDHPDGLQAVPVTGALAAYLVLLHTCGVEAPGKGPMPELTVDPWTVWSAAGPDALEVLRREGAAVTCPALGTRFPRAA